MSYKLLAIYFTISHVRPKKNTPCSLRMRKNPLTKGLSATNTILYTVLNENNTSCNYLVHHVYMLFIMLIICSLSSCYYIVYPADTMLFIQLILYCLSS